jgi:nitric oxide reductase activation protein
VIDIAAFKTLEATPVEVVPSEERRDAIRKNLRRAAQILKMTQEELRQSGCTEDGDLESLADSICDVSHDLVDRWQSLGAATASP